MKLKRRTREVLSFAACISALSLCLVFVIEAIRKKSILKAVMAVLAAEGAAGSAFCLYRTHRGACTVADTVRTPNAAADAVSDENADDELFDEQGSREAELRIRHVFCAPAEGEGKPSLRRDVPRDEEATEADFQ